MAVFGEQDIHAGLHRPVLKGIVQQYRFGLGPGHHDFGDGKGAAFANSDHDLRKLALKLQGLVTGLLGSHVGVYFQVTLGLAAIAPA